MTITAGTPINAGALGLSYYAYCLDQDHLMTVTGGSIRVARMESDGTFTVLQTYSVSAQAIQFIHPFYEDSNHIYVAATLNSSTGADQADLIVARWNKNTSQFDAKSNQLVNISGHAHQTTRPIAVSANADGFPLLLGVRSPGNITGHDEAVRQRAFRLSSSMVLSAPWAAQVLYFAGSGGFDTILAPNCSIGVADDVAHMVHEGTNAHDIRFGAYSFDESAGQFTAAGSGASGYTEFGRSKDGRVLNPTYAAAVHTNRGSFSGSYNHRIAVTSTDAAGVVGLSQYTWVVGGSDSNGLWSRARLGAWSPDWVGWFFGRGSENTIRGVEFERSGRSLTNRSPGGSIWNVAHTLPAGTLFSDIDNNGWMVCSLTNERTGKSKGKLVLTYRDVNLTTWYVPLSSTYVLETSLKRWDAQAGKWIDDKALTYDGALTAFKEKPINRWDAAAGAWKRVH